MLDGWNVEHEKGRGEGANVNYTIASLERMRTVVTGLAASADLSRV